MDLIFAELLSNIYLWIFVASVIGGYIALRSANGFRDKAALANYPDSPDKFLLRARISYGVFIVFLLAMIGGLGIVVFQVLQIVRPTFQLPFASATGTPEITAESSLTPTPTLSIDLRTATPAPTSLPTVTPSATISSLVEAEIGNTNFQGANVRDEPGLSSTIIAKLQNKSVVYLTGEPTVTVDGFTWQQIQLEDGTLGWIVKWYLIEETSDPPPL